MSFYEQEFKAAENVFEKFKALHPHKHEALLLRYFVRAVLENHAKNPFLQAWVDYIKSIEEENKATKDRQMALMTLIISST